MENATSGAAGGRPLYSHTEGLGGGGGHGPMSTGREMSVEEYLRNAQSDCIRRADKLSQLIENLPRRYLQLPAGVIASLLNVI